jgi:hypothetical protein
VGQGAVDFTVPVELQQDQYVQFISQLRKSVCELHGKKLVFRTWDTSGFTPLSPARLHPSLGYYMNVTSRISTHPNLIFSIKHTALDFWRFVGNNPTLTAGGHKQLIEVECAREYEGKGSMTNYIAEGVIDGFSEFGIDRRGISKIAGHANIVGLWLWTSGGGWSGPHVGTQTLWPLANALTLGTWWTHNTVIGADHQSPVTETQAFVMNCERDIVQSTSSAAKNDCMKIHKLAILSQDAVLYMHYCSAYDGSLQAQGSQVNGCGTVSCMPTNNWLRDDRMGGLKMLGNPKGNYGNAGAIYWLWLHNKTTISILEKHNAVVLWRKIVDLSKSVKSGSTALRTELTTTATYGSRLSEVIYAGWSVMIIGYGCVTNLVCNKTALRQAIVQYGRATTQYNNTLQTLPTAASPYITAYEGLNESTGRSTWAPGLDVSVDSFRHLTAAKTDDSRCNTAYAADVHMG